MTSGGAAVCLSSSWRSSDWGVDEVNAQLEQAGLAPRDVGILVVNCSLFCPTPSLASMVVNHFGLPSDTITFNLGGMGCSAGVIATTLAQEQLQFHKDKVAVVLSMENITQNFYAGQDIAMAIQNLLFFVGASATVLSNRGEDAERGFPRGSYP